MDIVNNTHSCEERKRGQHLRFNERGMIETLHKEGKSLREIGRSIGVSASTVWNELKRGTPSRTSLRGRPPVYKSERGQYVYESNRLNSHKKYKILSCKAFEEWVTEQIRTRQWSFDTCVGYAKRKNLFDKDAMVSTKTLYNALKSKKLFLTLFDMPDILKRIKNKKLSRENKRLNGRSIEERPPVGTEFGHWEIDTVVGMKIKGSCILTLIEKQTRYYITIRISGKTSKAVLEAMNELHKEYGERFCQVFKSITADNGTEFTNLSSIEKWGTQVYFAHPYSSWERPQNERHNGLLRRFIPKGKSIEEYSDEEVLRYSDEINTLPRRCLQYKTPDELFEAKLDEIYAA